MFALLSSKLAWNSIVAFAITVGAIYLLKPVAIKMGLQDLPGGRKQHKCATPIVGGISMFIGFCFSLLALNHSLEAYRGFLAASGLLVFVGILDDMHELSAKARFLAQIFAALLMIFWGNNIISSFGNLLFYGPIVLGWLSIPITVFATVGAINAVNMLDGIDGLLGSTALIQFLLLAYIAHASSSVLSYAMLILIAAVLFAYLLFNFPRKQSNHANIFMGDAGSMFLGFCLAWFFIELSQSPTSFASPITMLWIFAIPLFDTTWLLIKRSLEHNNPLKPGRDHLHHLLHDLGFSDTFITLLVSAFTLLLGILGLVAAILHIEQGLQFLAFIGLFFIYCIMSKCAWQYMQKPISA